MNKVPINKSQAMLVKKQSIKQSTVGKIQSPIGPQDTRNTTHEIYLASHRLDFLIWTLCLEHWNGWKMDQLYHKIFYTSAEQNDFLTSK